MNRSEKNEIKLIFAFTISTYFSLKIESHFYRWDECLEWKGDKKWKHSYWDKHGKIKLITVFCDRSLRVCACASATCLGDSEVSVHYIKFSSSCVPGHHRIMLTRQQWRANQSTRKFAFYLSSFFSYFLNNHHQSYIRRKDWLLVSEKKRKETMQTEIHSLGKLHAHS